MSSKIVQGLMWLDSEAKKDKQEINYHKKKLIEEIKSIKKEELIETITPKKISMFEKIKIIFSGKKR